jgi:stage V sporulation protein D (sporulation-specific penicillin-binding protein)
MILNQMKRKLFIIRITLFSLLVAIFGKLAYSQTILNENLKILANDLWERSFPIEASRGYIYDRNGVALAINLPVMSVAVIPFQVKEPDYVAKMLSIILNASETVLKEKITKRVSIVRLQPEGRQISNEQADKIAALKLKGVYLVQDSLRYYPYNGMMASTLGFVGIDNQGLAGLEASYDYYLKGKNGSLNYMMDAKGNLLSGYESRFEAPVNGMSISLTIDYNIQSVVERELTNAYLKYQPESIIALAMNPKTGEILAIANQPTFDPNNYQSAPQEIYNRNLPVWKSYEPGSTFKIVTFAAGLEEKVFDMYKDTYYDRGYEIVGGKVIKSWKKGGHGLQTFLEVIQNSSNPGFVEISRRLGNDRMYDYIKKFGFGEKTGVDIYGESKGIIFSKENYGVLEQATSSFGQGVSVTPIQLVTAFSAAINGGELLKPYILDSVVHTSTNDVIYKNQKNVKRQVISKETSDLMRIALESVVALGTGRTAYIDGYRVGGKTGTAQKVKDGVYMEGNYILSFIGGAPMNDPQIVVYVAIDNPKSAIQYGGTVVGPIVKNILQEALSILNVEKQDYQIEKEYTWMDTKLYEVPNYIGMDKSQVKSKNFKIVFVGEGNKVIDQLPKVGERQEQNKEVIVMLG